MCRFKTHPCVPAERVHVEHMRAFCPHTRMHFENTHGDVLCTTHGEKGKGGGGGVCVGGVRGGYLLSLSSLLSVSISVL